MRLLVLVSPERLQANRVPIPLPFSDTRGPDGVRRVRWFSSTAFYACTKCPGYELYESASWICSGLTPRLSVARSVSLIAFSPCFPLVCVSWPLVLCCCCCCHQGSSCKLPRRNCPGDGIELDLQTPPREHPAQPTARGNCATCGLSFHHGWCRGRISSSHLQAAIACFLHGTSYLPPFASRAEAGRQAALPGVVRRRTGCI